MNATGGFSGEPTEWFRERRGGVKLMFTHSDPRWVMHPKSRACRTDMPHRTDMCPHLTTMPVGRHRAVGK